MSDRAATRLVASSAAGDDVDPIWDACRFLTCSVLPVRVACNCRCRFCFSRSSISALPRDPWQLAADDVRRYYAFAHARGARRLVITGGGEPLLLPGLALQLVELGRERFDEIALFSNGAQLDRPLAAALAAAGLSYVCFSRHHDDDDANRRLMGASAPALDAFVEAAGELPIRATCVMARDFIEHDADVWRYIEAMRRRGIRQLTFKHTYVAYEHSVFGGSRQNRWAQAHQVERDPFEGIGEIVERLPWGPVVRRHEELTLCYYREPTPQWERAHRLARSSNLLSDGSIYASLEDRRSRLIPNPA